MFPRHPRHRADPENVLGVLSLIFWSLTLIISVKYLIFVMRADNKGEGGILALMALVSQSPLAKAGSRAALIALGLFGAALLYGDGMITPAISVLGAVEGLNVATHVFEPFVVPVAIVILLALFLIQSRGTRAVGALFGPVMVVLVRRHRRPGPALDRSRAARVGFPRSAPWRAIPVARTAGTASSCWGRSSWS